MAFVNDRGCRLWYRIAGHGEPLVLTGGFGLLHDQYEFVVRELARHFTVVAPENNIFGGVPAQSYDTVADGFYLMIAPLPPGDHTITFGGSGRNFAADVTYNLFVEP